MKTGTGTPSSKRPLSPNRRVYLAFAGVAVCSVLAGAGLKLLTQHDAAVSSQVEASSEVPVTETAPSVSEIAVGGSLPFQGADEFYLAQPGLLTTGLLRSTPPQARVETVRSGRLDPFAPLVVPTTSQPRSSSAPTTAAASPLPTTEIVPLPSLPVPPLPALPPVPITPLPANPAALPPALPVAATSPLDQLAISGVIQIGDRVSAIVQESPGASSRYVVAGDSLAAGALQVLDIDVSTAEPVVVLSYQGETHRRLVGSRAAGI